MKSKPTKRPSMQPEAVAEVLEKIKDSLTGDQCNDIGLYEVEPFIIRAVNSHDVSVEAMQYALTFIRVLVDDCKSGAELEDAVSTLYEAVEDKLEAALKQAEEK